jgi:hypothetical protein
LKVIRLKIEREASPKKAKAKMKEIIDKFYAQPTNKSARLIIDVDPL